MRLVPPTSELVQFVAENVRREDHNETMLSHGINGYEAVLISVANSDECRGIEGDDGIPIGVTGLYGDEIWMLGTPGLTSTRSHRRQLVTLGRAWVAHCLTIASPIGNNVLASNTRSVRWLQALGFQVLEPRPMGPSCALFRPFSRSR